LVYIARSGNNGQLQRVIFSVLNNRPIQPVQPRKELTPEEKEKRKLAAEKRKQEKAEKAARKKKESEL
jgi:hypothetical protein